MKINRPLAAPLFALLLLPGCGDLLFPPPSDQELLRVFRDKQEVFNELVTRMCTGEAEKVVMMSPEWARPEIGEAEKQEFYRLFKEIGAKGAQAAPWQGECILRIPVWSVGLGGDGDYKGYNFGRGLHGDVTVWLESLDGVDRRSLEISFFAREIDEDWSLYFDHWP